MFVPFRNISLLAFVLAIKAYRRNSVIYAHEKAYKLAPLLGISPQTFNRYMACLDEQGLIRHAGGHRTIIALNQILPALFPEYHNPDHPNTFHRCRFFRWQEKSCNVKHHIQQIRFALANLNFQQQQHNSSQTEVLDAPLTDRFNYQQLRQYKALLKKHGANCLSQLRSTVRRIQGIVTGKHHLSRLLGCSPSTARNLLRRWHQSQWVIREVKRKFIPCFVCGASYDALRAQGYTYIRPNGIRTGFNVSIGSSITVLKGAAGNK